VEKGKDKQQIRYALQSAMAGADGEGYVFTNENLAEKLEKGPESGGLWAPTLKQGGQEFALYPFTLSHSLTVPGRTEIHGEAFTGVPICYVVTTEVLKITPTPGMIFLPSGINWLRVGDEMVHLFENPLEVENLLAGRQASSEVVVKGFGGGTYGLDGPPVADVDNVEKESIKTADAEFLLVGLGLTQEEARTVLDASELQPIRVSGLQKIAKACVDPRPCVPLPERADLLKEAAALDDYDTVDKVLSLGFLSEANRETFREYLGELEKSASHLASLLLAARVGEPSIPEEALERSMHAVDRVVSSLAQRPKK
jgi:hypothetical protein